MPVTVSQNSKNDWHLAADTDGISDPLLDCLVALTRLHHHPHSGDALKAGLPLEEGRLTPALLARAASRAGLNTRVVKRPLGEIPVLVLPAILLLDQQRACVLLDINQDEGSARILLPEAGMGEKALPLVDLEANYTGYAVFSQSVFRFDDRSPEVLKLRSRHWFWGVLQRSWRIYRDVLVASFLINLFALASPLFIMNVYDRVVPNQAMETLWVLTTGVLLVFVFDFMMRSLRGYFIDVAGKRADVQLSAAIFEQVLGLKMASRPQSVGAFASNLKEFESIRDFITSATVTTLVDLPFMLFFLVVISLIGGPLVLVPSIGIPLILLYSLLIQSPLRKAVENTFRASAQKNATLVESLSGAETIKSLGAESVLQRKWEQSVGYIARWGARSRLLSASAVNVAGVLQQTASVMVVVSGVYLIAQGELSMGGLIAAVILTGRAMAPMGQVASLATRYYQARAALKSLNEIMKLPVDRPDGKVFLSRPEFKGTIEFENVDFSYPGQEQPVLKSISFRIQPGEHVAVIGRVGSGKTTLEKLIQGLYPVDRGALRIDGIDALQIDPADLRRSIGYVPQDITLFYGSVRDNIVLGVPDVDDKALLKAAELAGVTTFVNRHPKGFDMPVGERGDRLSGGQRQSIALARALLMDPPFLLLDEPTNSMDNSSEEAVKRNLEGMVADKTVVLVTHRASLLDLVDRVIVLDNGTIVADGARDEVLEALRQGKLRVSRW